MPIKLLDSDETGTMVPTGVILKEWDEGLHEGFQLEVYF